MNYFLDTEFMENGPNSPIRLLSVALVCEDGRELYLVNSEADHSEASEWVKENVIPYLAITEANYYTLPMIRGRVRAFIGPHRLDSLSKPNFWGYYADYDWVVFCQIFGAMIDLPEGWPMYCRDLKQWCDQLGNPKLPQQSSKEHNALNDARWNKLAWDFLAKAQGDLS